MDEGKSRIHLPGVDVDRPSVARVYDYYLGGNANWAVDREFGARVLESFPLLRNVAIANRLFLNRLVRHLTNLGIRQFLDIGAGMPTVGSTHQIADELAAATGRTPDAHVVYVDNEPIAVAHAEILLEKGGDRGRHGVIRADLREPDDLWRDAMATGLLDPDEPIALLLIAVLHVHQPGSDGVTDIGPESVARLRELLPVGSYLAMTHITDEGVPPEVGEKLVELKRMYDTSSSSDAIWRSHRDIEAMLGDFAVLEPGWTWLTEWHPEETGPTVRPIAFPTPNHAVGWAGVGRKTV
ncbi:SAM-dependent methyltransferase [Actinophytocola oryzae]|uniref:S-adenosyl methyltransferase n=1 Tax=Actinophytocola oryzae TaxID=502181 RepID=A0A4R7W4K4_9PSEU|nr:SAM-dependent methyltransferase [Actinophytocola oryzae]TDV56567.1 S-adenosyl methyltransferase [Actinophytocola oryzae]